jgi:hypothetical protein
MASVFGSNPLQVIENISQHVDLNHGDPRISLSYSAPNIRPDLDSKKGRLCRWEGKILRRLLSTCHIIISDVGLLRMINFNTHQQLKLMHMDHRPNEGTLLLKITLYFDKSIKSFNYQKKKREHIFFFSFSY